MSKYPKVKKPELGDWIVHTEPAFKRENEGEVIQLLAAQFVYQPPGNTVSRFCLYKELWKHGKRPES